MDENNLEPKLNATTEKHSSQGSSNLEDEASSNNEYFENELAEESEDEILYSDDFEQPEITVDEETSHQDDHDISNHEISSHDLEESHANAEAAIEITEELPTAPLNINEEIFEEQAPMNSTLRDTIFGEEDSDKAVLAEINFDLVDAGRWLLKVIAGPNNGAEFSMHSASSYVVGTDPTSCDIVFHDTSVSRQHARITLAADEGMTIEDLKSRNQTLVDGEPIKTKTKLMPNSVVTVGTTSFTVYDREGEMQTIISPLLPAIVKVLKEEPAKSEPAPALSTPVASPAEAIPAPKVEEAPNIKTPSAKAPEKAAHAIGTFIVLGIIAALFAIIGLGMDALFRSEPVSAEHEAHPLEIINQTLKPFPSITPWFNKSTGNLQLMGHVMTSGDKTRLIWSLRSLPFINAIDDKDVIIDEYVWQEANLILAKNPTWKNITIQSPSPGKFILTGYLQTRSQADQLSEYVASIFPFLDLLEKRITVEEDVVNKANNILNDAGLKDIAIKMENRVLTLTGGFPPEKAEAFQSTIDELKKIPGVLDVKNLTTKLAPEQSIINISDKYEVTGFSRSGGNYSVVIHGRILTKGDELDGMQITEIRQNAIMLEKDGVKYRIDFSR